MNRESISEHGEYRASLTRRARGISPSLFFFTFSCTRNSGIRVGSCSLPSADAASAKRLERTRTRIFWLDDTFTDYPGTNIERNIPESFRFFPLFFLRIKREINKRINRRNSTFNTYTSFFYSNFLFREKTLDRHILQSLHTRV